MEFDDPRLTNENGTLGWFTAMIEGEQRYHAIRSPGNVYTYEGEIVWTRTRRNIEEDLLTGYENAEKEFGFPLGPPAFTKAEIEQTLQEIPAMVAEAMNEWMQKRRLN